MRYNLFYTTYRPPGNDKKPLKALIFDSWYDSFYGVVCLVLVVDGRLRQGEKVEFSHSKKQYEVQSIGTIKCVNKLTSKGIMHPELTPTHGLFTGQVGFIVCGMKSTKEARIGDTLYHAAAPVEVTQYLFTLLLLATSRFQSCKANGLRRHLSTR